MGWIYSLSRSIKLVSCLGHVPSVAAPRVRGAFTPFNPCVCGVMVGLYACSWEGEPCPAGTIPLVLFLYGAGLSHSRGGAWNGGGPGRGDSRCSVLLVFLPFLLAGRALEGSVMLKLEMCLRVHVGFAMNRPPLDSFRAWFLRGGVNRHGAGTRVGVCGSALRFVLQYYL